MNKSDILEALILGYSPHVVVITETWLRSEVHDNSIFPPSYQVFRRDRSSKGGGVAVLIKQNISAALSKQINNHETITLKLSCWGFSLVLVAIYRRPDAPPEFLQDLCDHVLGFRQQKIIIAGDFNLPGVNWENPFASNEPSAHVHSVLDLLMCCNLEQVVRQPTRVQGSSSSILDLVFLSRCMTDFSVTIEPGLSDHYMVKCVCHFLTKKSAPSKTVAVKDYLHAADESVLDFLDINLSNFGGSDVSELWETFKRLCLYCIDHFVPNKMKRIAKKNPWITRDILHQKRKLKRLRRHRASQTTIHTNQTLLNQSIRCAKQFYFQHTLPDFIRTAPDKFWSQLSRKKEGTLQIIHNDTIVVDETSIATHFNEYFQSVFQKDCDSARASATSPYLDADIVSLSGVVSMLLNLKTKASPGPDNIHNAFLRRYAEMVAKFLVIIFRASLSSSSVPIDWKIARIVPILKSGDKLLITNYRPISITCSCCKLLEHVIANYITNFLNENNILTPFQHGFRKGLSTVTQLVTVIHTFASILDKSGQIDVIFLDFRKAFDLVPHNKLIFKLKNIGLPEFIVNWVSAYLSNRTQFVDINGHCSSKLQVTSGVPQGSVLGPLLFLIYINDIVEVVPEYVGIRLFADDCVLYKEIVTMNDQQLLNTCLDNVYQWCKQWDMKLNSDKTVYMNITRKKNFFSFPYALQTHVLREVSVYKYLGVTITKNLSWNMHVSNICASAFRKLCFLKYKLRFAPSSVKLLAYNTIIRPSLEYACVIWDPYTRKNIHAIEMIQRKCIRFIFSKYRMTDSPTAIMKENNIQELQLRRKILRLKFLFQLKHKHFALDASTFIQPLTSRETRNRHAASITPFQTRTNTFKFSFFPRTIVDWNALPFESLQNIEHFDFITS